jgi:hypothetical protein
LRFFPRKEAKTPTRKLAPASLTLVRPHLTPTSVHPQHATTVATAECKPSHALLLAENRIVGIGYNGFPRGCDDDALPWGREVPPGGNELDTKYPFVCHAEMNAILNKNQATIKDCKMYVALFPCNGESYPSLCCPSHKPEFVACSHLHA